MSPCLTEPQIGKWLDGSLEPEEAQELLAHTDECKSCLALLMLVARPLDVEDAQEPALLLAPHPSHVDEYRIVGLLGQGAMGQVYLALDTALHREVAIKFISKTASTGATRERFLTEARAIARLSHANVVSVYRVGEVDGRPYLVSERVRGKTLDQLVLPLPFEQVFSIAQGLSRGLAAAHKRGVLHRDIKPQNAILTDEGEVKLLDFGLAKLVASESSEETPAEEFPAKTESPSLTHTGMVLGTPRYLAPEIWSGDKASPRSDVYSLGAVLYELCTGRPPHEERTLDTLQRAVQEHAPPRLNLSGPEPARRFAAIVERCLSRDPAKRFASAEELCQTLDSVSAPPGNKSTHLALVGIGGTLLLGLLALLVFFVERRPVNHFSRRQSVAILGFQDGGGAGHDTAWLSTALSDLLGAELASFDRLRLLPFEEVSRMRRELNLREAEIETPASLTQIRKNLGADLVLLGEYKIEDGKKGRQLQLRVRLKDTATTELLASTTTRGREGNLVGVVASAGEDLRRELGLGRSVHAGGSSLRALVPENEKAARLFAMGREKLRSMEVVQALALLQEAVAADPSYPLSHDALADAYMALGYHEKAKTAGRRAFELSGRLPREERLLIEARYRTISGERDKAVELSRALVTFFPDSLEYGLRLSQAQSAAGQQQEAIATLRQVRRLPPPLGDDPRIDLAEGQIAGDVSDMRTMAAASARAAQKGIERGAVLLLARARTQQAAAAHVLGEWQKGLDAAMEARRICSAKGDYSCLADVLNAISLLHHVRGEQRAAMATFEEGLTLGRKLGSPNVIGMQLLGLAVEKCIAGYPKDALPLIKEVFSIAPELRSGSMEASAHIVFGWVAFLEGRLQDARTSYEAGFSAATRSGDRQFQAWAHFQLGALHSQRGDMALAKEHHQEGLRLRKEGGLMFYQPESLIALSELSALEGRRSAQRAEAEARDALSLARSLNHPDLVAWAQAALGQALLLQGQNKEAAAELAQATQRGRASEHLLIRLAVETIAARVGGASGRKEDHKRAEHDLLEALSLARRAGFVPLQLELRLALFELGKLGVGTRRDLLSLANEAASLGFHRIERAARSLRRGY